MFDEQFEDIATPSIKTFSRRPTKERAPWHGSRPSRSRETNLQIAEQFLKLMAEQAAPEKIADLFSQDLVFEIPGDDGVLPWIGRKTDEEAVELANGTDFGLKALSILAWRDS